MSPAPFVSLALNLEVRFNFKGSRFESGQAHNFTFAMSSSPAPVASTPSSSPASTGCLLPADVQTYKAQVVRMVEKLRRLEQEAESSRKDRDYYRTRCVSLEAQLAAKPAAAAVPNVVRMPFVLPPGTGTSSVPLVSTAPALSTIPLAPRSKAALAREQRAAWDAEIERERMGMAFAASQFGVDLVPRHWHEHVVQSKREVETELATLKATLSYKRKRDEQDAEINALRAENAKLKQQGDAAATMAAMAAVEVEDSDFV